MSIKGHSEKGLSAPVIALEEVRLIGKDTVPEPEEVNIVDFHSGVKDSQWVTLEGVVQQVVEGKYFEMETLNLTLAVPGGRLVINAMPPGLPEDPASLVDAEVRVTGVCIPIFNNRADVLESNLFTSGAGTIVVTKPAPEDPFNAPLSTLTDFRDFSPVLKPAHRQRFLAKVSAAVPGKSFNLVQGGRGMKAYTSQEDVLEPGDILECVGFVEFERRYPVIREAVFRKTGHAKPPAAEKTTVPEILAASAGIGSPETPDPHARLVTLEGILSRLEGTAASGRTLFLDSDGTLVKAILPPPSAADPPAVGSLLAATGIAEVGHSPRATPVSLHVPSSVGLMLRGPDDIRILRTAPWWTPARLWTALGAALLAMTLAFAWAAALRKRVALRGAELAEEMRARRDAEVGFEATLNERKRLAADLHDTLEQTLTGIALQIHATRTAPDPARAERNLGLAERMLGRSREEVRRSVWNLRPSELDGKPLHEVLRESCEDTLSGSGIRFRHETSGPEKTVNDFISGNLLLFTKEAVTNAIKHAAAETISLETGFSGESVTVSVADDGRGFRPDEVAGPHKGHFGLTGMRERARRMDGRFSIESIPGEGTRVTLSAPLSIFVKTHEARIHPPPHRRRPRAGACRPRLHTRQRTGHHRHRGGGERGEAIALYRKHLPDIALFDIRMPGTDGLSALATVREEFPEAKILIISTSELDEDVATAINAGAVGYLGKTMDPAALAHAIREAHRGVPQFSEKHMERLELREELTVRETEVLAGMAAGSTNKEIAAKLFLSEHTVKSHVKNILAKLHTPDRAGAVAAAFGKGILKVD